MSDDPSPGQGQDPERRIRDAIRTIIEDGPAVRDCIEFRDRHKFFELIYAAKKVQALYTPDN